MANLTIEINGIKNIANGRLSIPIEKGIYCLVGINGSGKSTVLSCLAQAVFSSSLHSLNDYDYTPQSYVEFSYNDRSERWYVDPQSGKWQSNKADLDSNQRVHFNGLYEGSLFYGTRFKDSMIIDSLIQDGTIQADSIVDADQYVREKLSYILQGDHSHYTTLKRIKNLKIAEHAQLQNIPYFQSVNGRIISQYRMSSGECMLISLLHFVYNALIRGKMPANRPILMLVDEIELALHPAAIARLLELLNALLKKHPNLCIILTTHSPEVIHQIRPDRLYLLQTDNNNSLLVQNPCFPRYATRDVYTHDGYDFVILVEDLLAKYVVDAVIKKNKLRDSRLINILPVGGWSNVLRFQSEACKTNTFGYGTKVFSVLDGDIRKEADKTRPDLPRLYLPINSIEKFLQSVVTDPTKRTIKKEINDAFFYVKSLGAIVADYNPQDDEAGKTLYRDLTAELHQRGITDEAFVQGLTTIIMDHIQFDDFQDSLRRMLSPVPQSATPTKRASRSTTSPKPGKTAQSQKSTPTSKSASKSPATTTARKSTTTTKSAATTKSAPKSPVSTAAPATSSKSPATTTAPTPATAAKSNKTTPAKTGARTTTKTAQSSTPKKGRQSTPKQNK